MHGVSGRLGWDFPMPILGSFAEAFAKLGSLQARPQFDYGFRNLQNSLIRRLNEKIQGAQDPTADRAVLHELDRKARSLAETGDLANKYVFGMQSNYGKIGELIESAASLSTLLSADDDDTNITAAEAENFNTAKDKLVEDMRNLYVLKFPSIADGNRIEAIQDLADTLEGYTVTEGAIDPEGTENPNLNREIYDFVNELEGKLSSSQTAIENVIFAAHHYVESSRKKLVEIEAEKYDITIVQAAEKTREIEDLQIQYANLVRAISISFEVRADQNEQFAAQLNGSQRPEIGSILNLFI
jgi:hypothetical protein